MKRIKNILFDLAEKNKRSEKQKWRMKKNFRGEQKEFQRELRERERIIGERIQAKIETIQRGRTT